MQAFSSSGPHRWVDVRFLAFFAVLVLVAATAVGCEPDPKSSLRLFYLYGTGTNVQRRYLDFYPGITLDSYTLQAQTGESLGAFSAIATEPQHGGGGSAYILDGDLWIQTSCGHHQLTTSGTAAMPTLQAGGCGKIAFLEESTAYVAKVDGSNSVNLGPAQAVHLSPDGQKVVLDQGGEVSVCASDGSNCSGVTPPASADLASAAFSNDSSHLLFLAPAEGHVQLLETNADGSSPRQLTHFSNGDAIAMQPVGDKIIGVTLQVTPSDLRIVTVDRTSSNRLDTITYVTGGVNTFSLP